MAEVLGTKFSLAVTNAATRLEVTEGSIKLTKNDQTSVTVKAGEFAVAASGVELKAESLTRADH
jgi:ferric-dicitrate binding protein FerR (iron transport regulator)